MATPRMRTAEGVLAEIKASDPGTEVTLHYIRRIIHTNKVPVVCVGRKKLVDVDAVLEFLAKGTDLELKEVPAHSRIRRVAI